MRSEINVKIWTLVVLIFVTYLVKFHINTFTQGKEKSGGLEQVRMNFANDYRNSNYFALLLHELSKKLF